MLLSLFYVCRNPKKIKSILKIYFLDSQIPSYPNLRVFWRNPCKGKKKMGLFFSRTIVNYIVSSSPMSKKTCGKFSPMQLESMISLVSRTGRHLQRYDKDSRQVVGYASFSFYYGSSTYFSFSTFLWEYFENCWLLIFYWGSCSSRFFSDGWNFCY